ncbi:MAG: cyclopropane-fatty-acyl-phospholipid synthase [Gammaproteobacteria bacterium RIFCSPHIGHO2_12_FULL_41_15]|nr:MAG: cyclopropane-fatty-acyl-phospholipid synthase [Gammaproteobacteria bacterium RIFCSPHIGHO2_12_FULL_41_15]
MLAKFRPASAKKLTEKALEIAGIQLNGNNLWDMQVHDDRFYRQIYARGSLGLGEGYVGGAWDCDALDDFFYRVLSANLYRYVTKNSRVWWAVIQAKFMNLQSIARSTQVGEAHYDLGNDLYRAMLDPTMTYSCAYWRRAQDLDSAQIDKLDLVCKKLNFQPGMSVLDIGCGWGSFAKYAAENYGVSVLGLTISAEQLALAKVNCRGLEVELRLQDYREINTKFDRIVSLGMFEHVGPKNYLRYMQVLADCLTSNGLALLHTIGSNKVYASSDPWITKYIFPNGYLPAIQQIAKAAEGKLIVEDWHNFGADYDRTLMQWWRNFNDAWPNLRNNKVYDERFYRLWRYYLLSCAGAFRARDLQLWQIVLSKGGVPGGYHSVR